MRNYLELKYLFERITLIGLSLEFLLFFSVDLSFLTLPENIRLSRVIQILSIFIYFLLIVYQATKIRRIPAILFFFPGYVVLSFPIQIFFDNLPFFENIALFHGISVNSLKFAFNDILIFLYIFIFYFFIANSFFSNKKNIESFNRLLSYFFIISIIVGILSLFASLYGVQFVPRQLNYETITNLGVRFYGLFGEPRDAASALVFFLFVSSLYKFACHDKTSPVLIGLAAILLSLTQSGSLLFSLPIWLVFILFYSHFLGYRGRVIFVICFGVVGLFLALLFFSERVSLYTSDLDEFVFGTANMPPSIHLLTQFDNVFPFLHLWELARDLDVLRILFGFGFPAANFIKFPGDSYNLTSVTGEIPRLIMNHGLVGVLGWLCFVLYPIHRLIKIFAVNRQGVLVVILYLGLVALSLIHRSHLIYISAAMCLGFFSVISRDGVSNGDR